MCELIYTLWLCGQTLDEIARWSGLSKSWIAVIIERSIEGRLYEPQGEWE
jgi:hypothetical protein